MVQAVQLRGGTGWWLGQSRVASPLLTGSSVQRQCHSMVLGVFHSRDVVQEVIASAKVRLFFPDDPCLLLCF